MAITASHPKSLVTRLKTFPVDKLPSATNYFARYQTVQDYLVRTIHQDVVAFAAIHDGGFLTAHGPAHVASVISRASELILAGQAKVSGYEAYLLLVAANLHDIGNARGRQEHELGAEIFVRETGIFLGDDAQEKRTITGIAGAHGGKHHGSKDKITQLRAEEWILGEKVHTRFMAALLRFADELADDKSRSSTYAFDRGLIPTGAEIYHKYALCLDTPAIEGDSVSLHFEVTISDLTREFGKGDGFGLLLDEIFDRTKKMDRERIYCMRFMRPSVQIERINVQIQIFRDLADQEPCMTISYRLEETGYPGHPDPDIICQCSGQTPDTPTAWTGDAVRAFFELQHEVTPA